MNPFLGEIRVFGFNFAPLGWALCNGQLIPISQNSALFSLLGTTYGGDGKSTFALPNLQGSIPLHRGQGPGLSYYVEGEIGGELSVTVTTQQMPPHSHPLQAHTLDPGDVSVPSATATLAQSDGGRLYQASTDTTLSSQALTPFTGGGSAHNNLMPYLTLNFCIALTGVYPSRS